MTFHAGSHIFGTIVDIVRKRTGLDYTTVFNRVLKDNRDLLGDSLDATNHTQPLTRLLNRAGQVSGLNPVDTTNLISEKISRLTNRFCPSLSKSPTALQWDILSRAVTQLENCDLPLKLYNRTSDPEISEQDWKTANGNADAVLEFLDRHEEKSQDAGHNPKWQKLSPRSKFWSFKNQVDRLMSENGLSRSQAFDKLKEEQPVFWAHAMLSFEPQK